jgi:DNA replication protein DnaC
MRHRGNPHLARQHRTQLLQSVAFSPGTGKTHLAIGLAIRGCQAGHWVQFATAAQWVARLAEAHHAGRLQAELVRLGRYPLLVIDEVGYIPFEPEAAKLFFQLVSARYERASLIVTSNKPFGRWGETFGDEVVAAAMIDRLVHHAEVIALKGDSYRLKNRDLGHAPRPPQPTTDHQHDLQGVNFQMPPGGRLLYS